MISKDSSNSISDKSKISEKQIDSTDIGANHSNYYCIDNRIVI